MAEPRLPGPNWRRGLLFASAPCLLSLLVYLPAMGGGILGLELGAGPPPVLGNLVLHLVYGAALGLVYPQASNRALVPSPDWEDLDEGRILADADRALAIGIVVGLVAGAAVGAVGPLVGASGPVSLVPPVVGAVAGAAVGALIGSFVGLSSPTGEQRSRRGTS